MTPYGFGHAIARLQDADDTPIDECQQADVSRDAARPSYTCLDVTAVEEELGHPQPTLEDDLRTTEAQFEP